MFENVNLGDRIRLTNILGDEITVKVTDKATHGSWVEFAGGATLYDDNFDAWKLEVLD